MATGPQLLQVSVPSTNVYLHWHVLDFLKSHFVIKSYLEARFHLTASPQVESQHSDHPVLGVLWRESWCGLCWGSCSRASQLKFKGLIDSNMLICDQVRDNIQIKINWTSNVWPWDSENMCKAASAHFWVTFKAFKYLALQQNHFKAVCTRHIHHYYYCKYEQRFTSTLQRNQKSRSLWSFTNK